MAKGAWVRPKHPKKAEEPVSTTEALLPMLSWIGGRNPRSRSASPTKQAHPARPLQQRQIGNDPILQSLQRAQAQQEERPVSVHSHKTRSRASRATSRHQQYEIEVQEEEEEEEEPRVPYPRHVLPMAPHSNPYPVARRQPPRKSYERPAPEIPILSAPTRVVRETRPTPQANAWARLQEDRRRRRRDSISSAWEDAITPLQRCALR